MSNFSGAIVVTGASGLVGGELLRRLMRRHPHLCAFVLVRDPGRWEQTVRRHGLPRHRTMPISCDLTVAGMGLGAVDRARLRCTTTIVHLAADTSFAQSLPSARAINLRGTQSLLEVAAECMSLRRFIYVSTAFAVGCRTGRILETESTRVRGPDGVGGADGAGWVNAYEQSKHEAEWAVRSSGLPWVIVRPSTIVCDDERGGVSSRNAVHRSLRLLRAGLAPMLPGAEETPVDVVPNDHVAECLARIVTDPAETGRTYHLCAGAGAMPLGELVDRSYSLWSRDPAWRRRALPRPALTDLATYRLFESTVHLGGDPRMRQVVGSLSHFVPQLAFPKRFDTAAAEAATGLSAPPVTSYWERMLKHLLPGRAASRQPQPAAQPSAAA
jgi:nucleoside-diphosphate-sugar epimerase